MTPGFTIHESSHGKKKEEEDTQYTCEPLGDLRYLFRTTNECHFNKHPQYLVSGGSSQKDLNATFPKELCLPFLERGILGS